MSGNSTQALNRFVGTDRLASVGLSHGFEQLSFQLWRKLEGLVGLAREDGHNRTLGEGLPGYDDFPTDHGTCSELHA